MSDLIRREDALKAAEAGPSFYMIQTDTGFRESRGGAFAIRSDIAQALAAIPAVQPQCCMCAGFEAKPDPFGGPPSQLTDGRWVCSIGCYFQARLIIMGRGDK